MEVTIQINQVLAGSQDNLTDVVKKINYDVTATKGGFSYTATDHTATLDAANPSNFIPYMSITKQQMETMIKSSNSYRGLIQHMENVLDSKIESAQLEAKPLPF